MTQSDKRHPAPERNDGEAVFEIAWHAQALATANVLLDSGVLDRSAWSEALGAALRRREEPPGDAQNFYYECVVEALEVLLASGGQIASQELEAREQAWRNAYHRTPHGAPVELCSEDLPPTDAANRANASSD